MQNIAVVFASRNGQTRKIAHHLERRLNDAGKQVQTIDLSTFGSRELAPETDGVIVGGPVYIGHFPRKLVRWIRRHHEAMHDKATAFFSVSLNAADSREESRAADNQLLQKLTDAAGWVPAFLASFAGAINYREYSWPIRRVMVNRAQSAGGPTDTGQDYEFTDWKTVDRFLEDFLAQNELSPFTTLNRLSTDWAVNKAMPEFEQAWSHEIEVPGTPQETWAALQRMDPQDMTLARVLARIRTFGRHEEQHEHDTFGAAAERFGNVNLVNHPPNTMVAGLVGQFWRPGFGIRRVGSTEFANFNEPGFAKVITAIHIEPLPGLQHSRVRTEMRVHATSPDAARKFKAYWTLLNPGIKLYMRSMLAALRRETAEVAKAA